MNKQNITDKLDKGELISKELPVNKLNTLMAEEVMGWHKGMSRDGKTFSRGSWKDSSGFANWQFTWNPCEDMNQAMMCVEKAGITISIVRERYPESEERKWWIRNKSYIRIEVPKAICQAIAEAIGDKNE